ncbi:MAG: hypothetical protein QOI45_2062 [Thermoleophilaceae bacterium]|nr:hypothetical protein [Thermoleophilaceae bacterium]
MPKFCRHNRFVAECPICSKGTVLDPNQATARRTPTSSRTGAGARRANIARTSRGPFVAAGPYDGAELRLERVPGGLRLASWRGGQIERTAPVLPAADAPGLLAEAAAEELLPAVSAADAPPEPAEPGTFAVSAGRSGELRDELRVELLDDDRVRVARWVMRPNRGWELQQAPVMLPPKRFAEAFAAAARKGVLALPEGALASGGPGE